ncbi:hypothetical protein PG995_003811 [Apiospora arundinis]
MTPDLPSLSSFPAETAGPSASALVMQAGKAPTGGERSLLLPTAPENSKAANGSPGDLAPFSPQAAAVGEDMVGWHNTSHHGCPIQAKHRHDADGGIHFGGMRDLRQAMAAHTCSKLEEVSRAEWGRFPKGSSRSSRSSRSNRERIANRRNSLALKHPRLRSLRTRALRWRSVTTTIEIF